MERDPVNEPERPNVALAEAIEESGLRKGFIARQIGVSQSLLSHWLRGIRTPDQVQREKLALILRRDPDEFVVHAPEVCATQDAVPLLRRNDEIEEQAA